MSDERQATPKEELERRIMDPRIPKNESEWWASREIEKLRLELDMQQATILVPSQRDDQRRIERLDAALKETLDEAAALRARIESAEQAYVRLDASMNRLKAVFRVNMLRAFPHMPHDEIDAEIEAAVKGE